MGVLAQPAESGSARVAYLMFNAGVLPRVGPHRLNVKLARALAAAGQTSLRFDLSGQGDSRSATNPLDFVAQAAADIRSAMDHLANTFGIQRFALIGICSGAVSVFVAAQADPRVAGVMMFDGHWYRTVWTLPIRHWKRLRSLGWSDLVRSTRRRARGLFHARLDLANGKPTHPGSMASNPPRAEFVRALQALADRRVSIYFIYSIAAMDFYSYGNQFKDGFGDEPFADVVRCDHRPDIDHTFIALESQRTMIELVVAWVAHVDTACEAPA